MKDWARQGLKLMSDGRLFFFFSRMDNGFTRAMFAYYWYCETPLGICGWLREAA